jgi:hypothetical protein
MPRSGALLIYIVLFIVAGITAGLGARFGDWAMQVAACKMHREPGTFRAYCTSPYYGVYEQGAYWLDLEPAAIAHLKKAEVLFLGNSRAQFGFSTDKIRDYFRTRGIPFYVMGFSYGESSYFAIALIEKYHLKPKLVVIDADPFFNTGFSDPAKELFDESGSEIDRALRRVRLDWDYQRRRAFNHLQPALCAAFPRLCSGAFKSIYRSEADGLWVWRDVYAPAEHQSLPNEPVQHVLGADLAVDLHYAAEGFMERLPVPAQCVILTQVPNGLHDWKAYDLEMGRILGAPVVFPELPGLSTIDSSHLTWSSAQAWSEAFLRQADLLITRCAYGDSQHTEH